MDAQRLKAKRSVRRKHRVRKSIHGTAAKPRLSIFRSNFHIYAQLIDDENGATLGAASSNDKDAKAYGGNIAAAKEVGKKIAEVAKAKGITEAAFDRGSFRFHGRVKALARAATEGGLKCTGLEEKVKKVAAAPEPKAKKEKGEKKPAEAAPQA
jgi:large subunit ribosomal protein L18